MIDAPEPPDEPTPAPDESAEAPEPIDFAEFDLRAREWFDRFTGVIRERLPVTDTDCCTIITRDHASKAVSLAEERMLVACLDAMAAMARRYNPGDGPTFTIDASRCGRG